MKCNSAAEIGKQKTALGGVVKVDRSRRVFELTVGEWLDLQADQYVEFHCDTPKPADNGYLDRSGVAKFLDLSPGQIDKLCREHGLPFHRVGDVKRFDRDEIRAWVKAQGSK